MLNMYERCIRYQLGYEKLEYKFSRSYARTATKQIAVADQKMMHNVSLCSVISFEQLLGIVQKSFQNRGQEA